MVEFEAKNDTIEGDSVMRLHCNHQHIFHASCLKEWCSAQYTCPVCREILIPKERQNACKLKIGRFKAIVQANILITMQNDVENYDNVVVNQVDSH